MLMDIDSAGRIAGVQNQATGIFYAGAAATDATNRIQYSAHGAISQMKLGNGLWEHTNFNARLQATQIGLGTAVTNSSVLQLDYDYGTTANNGNLQTQTITLPGLTLNQNYTYDSLNRLETAKENNGSSWKQKFTYDRYGNRRIDPNPANTSADLIGPNPDFSPLTNRINPQTGEQYQYDGTGNLTRDRDGQTYGYDAENRMTSYNGGAGAGGATYNYDGDGKRVMKIVGSVTTVLVYDLTGRLVAEYSSGSPQNNGTRYLTSDNLGSPRVITDVNGTVTARHDYHSFGEEVGLKGGRSTSDPLKYVADNVRQKFTSKERDQETQLDFFEARYYASSQGRFTGVDPQLASGKRSKPQTWNRYSYALNNPYRYTDPDGEDATENPEFFLRRTTTTTKVIVQDQDGRGNVTQQAEVTITVVKTELVDQNMRRIGTLDESTTATAQNTGVGRAYTTDQLKTMENVAQNIVEVSQDKKFDATIALGIANTETRLGTAPAGESAAHKQPPINPMQLSGGKGKVDLRFNIAGAIDVFNANSASTNTLNQRLQDYNSQPGIKVGYANKTERDINRIRNSVKTEVKVTDYEMK